jgi:hypothetical protein
MHVDNAGSGRVFVVEPVEVFKKAKLNLGVASGLLKLLAPDVDADRQVDGEISLSLSKLSIPLGVPEEQAVKQAEAEGKITLHQVSTEVKSPTWQGLLRLLADLHGTKPPKTVHVVEESEIRFKIRDGRLHHEGQRIGIPEIAPDFFILSRGSIGVDDTLDLILELPRLHTDKGDKSLIQCHVTGTIHQPKFSIKDASLAVRFKEDKKAVFTAHNVNLTFDIETSGDAHTLTLAPVTVLNKQKLTPEVAGELLQLIAPTLADLAGVQGEISLSFEKFRVPLGVPPAELEKRMDLAGKVQLHEVSVKVKTPLLDTMVKVLADMYGKKPSDVVQVVKNADIKFHVRDGRVNHEGLRFGFPEFSPDLLITSSGSVGFDKSLDLVLEVPAILLDKKALEIKKAPPVHFRVTGTIEKPIVTKINGSKGK